MDVVYDQLRVDSALSVLQDKQGHRYVPIRQFASTLGFRLHVEIDKRKITGFLNSPSERIDFDGIKGVCRQGQKTTRFDPNLCFIKDGDVYLDANEFSKIAGLKLVWQMNLLQLEVSSTSPLNVEKQWIQRARDQVDQMAQAVQQSYHPIKIPYKLWSVPAIDAELYASGDMGDTNPDRTTRLSMTGSGDLFMMSARYRVMSDSQGQPTALLSLGKSDPDAQLLGKLHATQFEFGDLYMPPVPLLARGRNALGFTFSNFPLAGQEIRDRGQVIGKALPGSQIELYSRDQLLGSTKTDTDGNYRFNALRLDYGPNDLKVVTVTPDGDVAESSRRVFGGTDGPAAGETRYRLTAGRIGTSIYSSDAFGNVQNQDSSELIADFQRAIGNGSWASAVGALTQSPDGLGKDLGVGLHTWLGSTLFNVQSMVSLDGGSAISTGFTRSIGSARATLEHTQASGSLASRILPEIGANGTSLTSLKLEGTAGKRSHAISYGLSLDRLDGDEPATVLRSRLSTGDANLMYSNSLTMRLSQGPSDIAGFAQIRKSLGAAVGLFDLGYQLGSGKPIQIARLSVNRNLNTTYSARMGLEYDGNRSQPIGALATVYRAFGPVDLGLNLEVLQGGKISASLLFSTGLLGEGSQGRMALARPGAGEAGLISVRAFIDKHLSGKYEPDDPLLTGVSFLVDGHPRAISTGKNGRATIDRLPPNQTVSLSADEESFENPSWVSENPGVVTTPRPGRAVVVDFPILETGEIEGRLNELKGALLPPGLTAQLIDSKKAVADSSILDSVGTFVFSRVRPGDYLLRLIDLSGQTYKEREVKVAPAAILKHVDIDDVPAPKSPARP